MNTDLGLLILRVAAGGMMAVHGWGKLLKVVHGDLKFADPLGVGATATLLLAVFAEFFCAILVTVGYKTRLAAVPIVATMAVAAGVVHRGDPWGEKELPILYGAAFLAVAILGGGRYALESRFGKTGRKKK